MGCWNQTCGISNLHIRNGQDMVVFAMVKNNGIDSLCYTTPFYAPVMMPFYAKYNDYGGGEECTGYGLDLVINAIKKNLVELPVGSNQYHDIAVKKEGFDVDTFFEAVHENRLFVQGRDQRQRHHVNFMAIHGDVFNHIINKRKIERYVGDSKGNTGWDNNYIEITFADVLNDLPACVDLILNNASDESNMLARFDPLHSLRRMNESQHRASANSAAQFLYSEEYRFSSLVRSTEVVTNCIEAKDREGMMQFFTEYLKAQWIDGFMLDTRKFWSPQAGAGSQAQEPEGYLLLIDAMKRVLDAEKREYDEDCND